MMGFIILFAVALLVPVFYSSIDLLASGLFYRAGEGFFLANHPVFTTLHWLAFDGGRMLGVALAVIAIIASVRRKPYITLDAKAWLFLLFSLVIGVGLVVNVGFKDHWGRARPREVVEFGGAAAFSSALMPHFENARTNGSFVSGDGAFGFFLPAFAFVVPRRLARRTFWGCMVAGSLFGFARIAMGAHFLSDVLFAAAVMLAVI